MITQASTPIKDVVWMVCAPYLQSALDKTENKEWNLVDARKWVDDGKGMLLYAEENGETYASGIIGITNYHQLKAMEIYLMGSDGDYELLFVELIDYAKSEGCNRIDAAGRRWVKFLKRFGHARETYRAELEI